MYAIVDIETTGGHASASGITEIAIFIHDGEKVVQTFHSLVDPGMPVPRHIQALTGITDEMLEQAPQFKDIAKDIFEILEGKIFVAHHVNFDYSFVKHELERAGYSWQSKKLCTVRLSRKVFPGFPSYSLGNLCRQLEIPIENRHRAGGDAAATVLLFEKILSNDTNGAIELALKAGSREQVLPANLPAAYLLDLPAVPGVYYFHNEKDKVIYVGKAVNIKKRVQSHFVGTNIGPQRQGFLRNIYKITYQVTATELMAFILESIEIKRLWPEYNRAQKRVEAKYGLYCFEDQQGYLRLALERKRKHMKQILGCNLYIEGRNRLIQLVKQFNLCHKLCYLQSDLQPCSGRKEQTCEGACEKLESPGSYNKKVLDAIAFVESGLQSYIILDQGIRLDHKSCILVEKGSFYGMGYIPKEDALDDIETVKSQLIQYPDSEYIMHLIQQYANLHTNQVIQY